MATAGWCTCAVYSGVPSLVDNRQFITTTGISGNLRHRHGRMWARSYRRRGNGMRRWRLAVSAKADEPSPSDMSFETALKLLGVREHASFDEILEAKKALIAKSVGDQERVLQVEAAYDTLLMRRLMKRRAGEVADTSVLYADVRRPRTSMRKAVGIDWFIEAAKNVPLEVETPSTSVLTKQTAVYAGLIAWTYLSGFTPLTGEAPPGADATGITLALGFGASIYFLRQQNLKLGKAAAITTAGLIAGVFIGSVVESWLHVDIVPILGISSPVVMVSEFVLLSFWLFSLYLR